MYNQGLDNSDLLKGPPTFSIHGLNELDNFEHQQVGGTQVDKNILIVTLL